MPALKRKGFFLFVCFLASNFSNEPIQQITWPREGVVVSWGLGAETATFLNFFLSD